MNIRQLIRQSTLDPDDVLLTKHGITDDRGILTALGRRVLCDMLFEDEKAKILTAVKAVEDAEKEESVTPQEWQKVRGEWVKLNPSNHSGEYLCGICARPVLETEMTLDHIVPRSGSPTSAKDFSNLQPSHLYCNNRKGSRRLKSLVSAKEYELRRKLGL